MGAGASLFATLNFATIGGAAFGGAAAVANPLSVLGAGITQGDIVAELVGLIFLSLDKGEAQMLTELHGEEATPRLADGTPLTKNMPCTLMSGKGGLFRQHAEVQIVEIDPSGNHVIIQLRSGQSMQLQANPHPFVFRDLQATINFDMLLGMNGGAAASPHHDSDRTELEYALLCHTHTVVFV
jgi:hypothetical protein